MAPPSRVSSLAALDHRVVPVLAVRLQSVVSLIGRIVGVLRDDVRGQQEVVRGARKQQQVRSLRPVLQSGSQRVLGGLALVLLVAAVALLVVGG